MIKQQTKGAQTLKDKVLAYVALHLQAALSSLGRLTRTPGTSIATLMVMAVALLLPLLLSNTLNNLEQMSQGWQKSTDISLYLKTGLSEKEATLFKGWLIQKEQVLSVTHKKPEEGLLELEEALGLEGLEQALGANPLPHLMIVRPRDNLLAGLVNALALELEQRLEVAEAHWDSLWLERFQSFLALSQKTVLALSILLAFGVLMIIANSIRLLIMQRQQEITVIHRVGGTNAFIRRPFLYLGFWYGLGAAILAFMAALLVHFFLEEKITRLLSLYEMDIHWQGISLSAFIQLLMGSVVLGVSGAWFSVQQRLKRLLAEIG